VLTPEEQNQLDVLLNKERATEVVEMPIVEVLHAGNTTQTLAPTPSIKEGHSQKLPAGVTIVGQHYTDNGLTRQWVPIRK
jgi:hypothetical protein